MESRVSHRRVRTHQRKRKPREFLNRSMRTRKRILPPRLNAKLTAKHPLTDEHPMTAVLAAKERVKNPLTAKLKNLLTDVLTP